MGATIRTRAWACAVLAIGVVGCASEPLGAEGERRGRSAPSGAPPADAPRLAAPLGSSAPTAPPPSTPQPSIPSSPPATFELDRRADGARLWGAPVPPPANGDAERAMALHVVGADPSGLPARVLDARFAGDAVVTLGTDHVLRIHDGAGSRTLDEGVYGPLSIEGEHVAYVRGSAPLLEVVRASLRTFVTEQLTRAMAPCWSPALSPSDGAVVFVSAAEGTPRLYRATAPFAIEALPSLSRFPDSPSAPRFEEGFYVFEDSLGTVRVDLASGQVVSAEGHR